MSEAANMECEVDEKLLANPREINGSASVQPSYDSGYLVVRFRRSRNAAGKPSTYTKLVPVTAAWVDRSLNTNKPTMLKQKMTEEQATQGIDRLRQNGGFWRLPGQSRRLLRGFAV